jgi:hypothetical protein
VWISIPLQSFHLGLSYNCLVSSVLVVPHRFYPLPSYFFLRNLPKWHILSVYFSVSLAFSLIILTLCFLLWKDKSRVIWHYLQCWDWPCAWSLSSCTSPLDSVSYVLRIFYIYKVHVLFQKMKFFKWGDKGPYSRYSQKLKSRHWQWRKTLNFKVLMNIWLYEIYKGVISSIDKNIEGQYKRVFQMRHGS